MGKKTEPNIMARIEERRRIFERRYDLLDLEREYRGGEEKKRLSRWRWRFACATT